MRPFYARHAARNYSDSSGINFKKTILEKRDRLSFHACGSEVIFTKATRRRARTVPNSLGGYYRSCISRLLLSSSQPLKFYYIIYNFYIKVKSFFNKKGRVRIADLRGCIILEILYIYFIIFLYFSLT